MCIRKYNSSSSSSMAHDKKKALNPNAREWRPNPHPTKPPLPLPYHFLTRVAPHPQPPPFAAAPPPFPSYQGFTLPGTCTQTVYYQPVVDFPPPETAASGGATVVQGQKIIDLLARRKFTPPRFRRAPWVEKKPAGSRLMWRPRSSAAASSPPRAYRRNSPSPSDELSPTLKTTVMIKNIPNQLRRDFMLEFLDSYCRSYSLEYDFMYLPMDFRRMDNLGYAFVNFTSGESAIKFKEILQSYKWNTFQTHSGKLLSSAKICEITWARIQGKERLVKRFKNSTFACDKLGFLPVILDPPRNGSDPAPAPPVVLGKTGRVLHK
ncbi:hypothetical protein CASFOL_021798 [Castilleja foliolosa]|uniref:Mei2-like C-terminal RNA recognition motif domain-containing protein n=1 Tax=Castilleja foliolosa TaxID=1961234 RepID=A0ABD3D0B1_9LAMI